MCSRASMREEGAGGKMSHIRSVVGWRGTENHRSSDIASASRAVSIFSIYRFDNIDDAAATATDRQRDVSSTSIVPWV